MWNDITTKETHLPAVFLFRYVHFCTQSIKVRTVTPLFDFWTRLAVDRDKPWIKRTINWWSSNTYKDPNSMIWELQRLQCCKYSSYKLLPGITETVEQTQINLQKTSASKWYSSVHQFLRSLAILSSARQQL